MLNSKDRRPFVECMFKSEFEKYNFLIKFDVLRDIVKYLLTGFSKEDIVYFIKKDHNIDITKGSPLVKRYYDTLFHTEFRMINSSLLNGLIENNKKKKATEIYMEIMKELGGIYTIRFEFPFPRINKHNNFMLGIGYDNFDHDLHKLCRDYYDWLNGIFYYSWLEKNSLNETIMNSIIVNSGDFKKDFGNYVADVKYDTDRSSATFDTIKYYLTNRIEKINQIYKTNISVILRHYSPYIDDRID